MQQRHTNREQYFTELANTAREFYIDYLRPYVALTPSTRVLEIGCGEGGNLVPFAEEGCTVTGIDLSADRIHEAQQFFAARDLKGSFMCQNFITASTPQSEEERFDLILIHDVIEHIEPPFKYDFFTHIKPFLKQSGIIFFGFPAWQNPFGGHQQIAPGFASKMPYIHLLPNPIYRFLLQHSGTSQGLIDELMSIKRSQMPVETFERFALATGYTIADRTFWLINPHYKQKFHLRPRLLWKPFGAIPYLRNFYITSAFYLLKQ